MRTQNANESCLSVTTRSVAETPNSVSDRSMVPVHKSDQRRELLSRIKLASLAACFGCLVLALPSSGRADDFPGVVHVDTVDFNPVDPPGEKLLVAKTILEMTSELPDTICSDTITSASVIQVCARLVQSCQGGSTAPLGGRKVLFFVNPGSCGVGTAQIPNDSALTDEAGEACVTLGRLDTLLAIGKISFRAKFLGESAPDQTEPPNDACSEGNRTHLSTSNDCRSVDVVDACVLPEVDFNIVPSGAADVYFLQTVDIDRDNNTDVIYTGNSVEGLFIAYGTSGDALQTPISYLPINQAAIDAHYVNDDTLLDIVAVNAYGVYILLNNGDRTFSADSIPMNQEGSGQTSPSDQALAAVPSIVTGFFNSDNYVDLVAAPNHLWIGNGSGELVPAAALPFSFATVNAGDFNNDGLEDLAVTTGDSAVIYLNDGSGSFARAGSAFVGTSALDVSPSTVVADFNSDGNCDFADVFPLANVAGQSLITVALGDGAGGLLHSDAIAVAGVAYNLTVADVNHDNSLEVVVANATTNQAEIYFGSGTGSFAGPVTVDLQSGSDLAFALASLDLNRDGNFDFASGALNGGALSLAIDQQPAQPVLTDEMVTTAYSETAVKVFNPDGFIISENLRTVAGSDFQTLDIDNNGTLDDRAMDYNLQYGEYTLIISPEPSLTKGTAYLGVGIGIDGSQQATLFSSYDSGTKRQTGAAVDSLIFYYTVEPISSIQPPNGIPTDLSRPVFDWSLLVGSLKASVTYQFQLDRYYDFRAPIFDVTALASPECQPLTSLGDDSVFYWRFRSFDGVSWSDYSRTFAVYITGVCCQGSRGNVNGDNEGMVDLVDITYLAAYMFQRGPEPPCSGGANTDGDPEGSVNIRDVTYLVDYIFQSGPPPPQCP